MVWEGGREKERERERLGETEMGREADRQTGIAYKTHNIKKTREIGKINRKQKHEKKHEKRRLFYCTVFFFKVEK